MGIFNWGFRANVRIHAAPEDKLVELATHTQGTRSFSAFVAQDMRHVVDPTRKVWLAPSLFNGSLQTLYYTTWGLLLAFDVFYGRELFSFSDGGLCSLDWSISSRQYADTAADRDYLPPDALAKLHPNTRYFDPKELAGIQKPDQAPKGPLVVVLHGLAGGSHEPMIKCLVEKVGKAFGSENVDTVVVNLRGCCRTKVTTGRLFSAFSIKDVHEVLVELNKRFPKRHIYVAGFSFGAVILANYLGDMPQEAQQLVSAACLVGCPWDLVDSAYHIDLSLTGRYLLNPALTLFLLKLVKNNRVELEAHNPGVFSSEADAKAKAATKTWQFDAAYTCHTEGFSNPFDYYRAGSPVSRISKFSVPTLALNLTDDPAVGVRLPWMQAQLSKYLVLVETDLGGHLGFVQHNGDFWCAELVLKFVARYEETFAKN